MPGLHLTPTVGPGSAVLPPAAGLLALVSAVYLLDTTCSSLIPLALPPPQGLFMLDTKGWLDHHRGISPLDDILRVTGRRLRWTVRSG